MKNNKPTSSTVKLTSIICLTIMSIFLTIGIFFGKNAYLQLGVIILLTFAALIFLMSFGASD
jgi:hydrogenase-4 membrane subunit HyfE